MTSYNRPDAGNFGVASYIGDSSTTDFAFTPPFPNKGRLATGTFSPYVFVYVDDVSVNYTFTSTANDTIRLAVAPNIGAIVEIYREAGIGTFEVYSNGSDLDADTLAADSNRQSMILQDVWTRVRALGSSFGTLSTATAANEYNFVANGATTIFALGTETATGDARVQVYNNGLRVPTTDYNVVLVGDYSTVQFLVAPPNTNKISVVVWNSPVLSSGVDDYSITNIKLAPSSVSFDKLGMNATGSNGNVLVKRAGVWTTNPLTTSEITNFNTDVRASTLNQMAVPTTSLNLNSQKITALSTGTLTTDATNKGQMDTAIAAAITALNLSACRFKGGSTTVSGTTFGTLTIGFVWDTLILQLVNGNGDVGVRSTNTADTGGSGFNGSLYNPSATFIIRRSDITSVQRYQIRQNVGAPASNDHEIEIQYVTNGFQIRRTGTVATTYTVRYQASTDFTG